MIVRQSNYLISFCALGLLIWLMYVYIIDTGYFWSWSTYTGNHSIFYAPSTSNVSINTHASEASVPEDGFGREALRSSCYTYTNVTATNICCLLKSYNAKDLHSCAAAITQSGASKGSPRLFIAIVGDSRARQIFNSLAYLLRDTNMTYLYNGKSGNSKELISRLFDSKFHKDIRLEGVELPLTLTFYWDPYLLHSLPKILKKWLTEPKTQPHLLQIETGAHYLVYRGETAFGQYEMLWKYLLPNLTALAKTTHTVVKMIDHVAVKNNQALKAANMIDENINHMNMILSSALLEHPNNIIFWNTSSPLSDQYIEQCYKDISYETADSLWACYDFMHSGYVVIHQLRHMLLNSLCNRYIDLDHRHCR